MKTKLFLAIVLFIMYFGICKAQWEPIQSNTTDHLVDLCFVNDSTGFIIGYYGVVLKTTDNGNHWSNCAQLTGLFTSICHVGNDTIFVGGNNIYRSNDCGTTWQLIPSASYAFDMHFFSSAVGIYIMRDYYYCSSGTFSGSIPNYSIYRTVDSGQSWTNIGIYFGGLAPFDVPNDSACYSLRYLFNFYSYHCLTYGVSLNMIRSTDHGQTWINLATIPNSDIYSFINKDTAYLMSNGRGFYKTTDGGVTINYLATLTNMPYINDDEYKMLFTNDSVGYIIYKNIYKTGASVLDWATNYIGTIQLHNICKTKDGTVFVIGDYGTILKENPNFISNNLSYKYDSLKIYPNPAINYLTIEGLNNHTIAQVYDISGKLLLNKQLNTNQIDISPLAKGLYFIKLTSEEGSVVRKFVKE
jgi:hypothetical protein